jgi:N-acetylglutamate synthase
VVLAERAHVGLFDSIIAPESRNHGLAGRLCSALMQWARTAQRAETAYLGVVGSNAPAIHVYAKLGFREQYTYWYRMRM